LQHGPRGAILVRMSAKKQTEDIRRLSRDLWRKLKGAAAHLPFAEDAVAIYYCALDRDTPMHVRGAIIAALAYFIMPADTLPDFMPVLGFTDDAAILAGTLKLVTAHLRPEHRQAARQALGELEAA
jgi:uncharacterized membrane protein YkvA (DUF1232 family)